MTVTAQVAEQPVAATNAAAKLQMPAKDYTSTWPFPAERDGWPLAHVALRGQMSDIAAALAGFSRQLANGKSLTPEQAAAMRRFVASFVGFLHEHHHNEEEIAMPYLTTRIQFPKVITDDHKTLEDLLAKFEAAYASFSSATTLQEQAEKLPLAEDSFRRVQELCLPHFEAEESGPLLLMRAHFRPVEISKNISCKIAKNMGATECGIYFGSMGREGRAAFYRQEGIPFFVRWILNHRVRKYERDIYLPFKQLCLKQAA